MDSRAFLLTFEVWDILRFSTNALQCPREVKRRSAVQGHVAMAARCHFRAAGDLSDEDRIVYRAYRALPVTRHGGGVRHDRTKATKRSVLDHHYRKCHARFSAKSRRLCYVRHAFPQANLPLSVRQCAKCPLPRPWQNKPAVDRYSRRAHETNLLLTTSHLSL